MRAHSLQTNAKRCTRQAGVVGEEETIRARFFVITPSQFGTTLEQPAMDYSHV